MPYILYYQALWFCRFFAFFPKVFCFKSRHINGVKSDNKRKKKKQKKNLLEVWDRPVLVGSRWITPIATFSNLSIFIFLANLICKSPPNCWRSCNVLRRKVWQFLAGKYQQVLPSWVIKLEQKAAILHTSLTPFAHTRNYFHPNLILAKISMQ